MKKYAYMYRKHKYFDERGLYLEVWYKKLPAMIKHHVDGEEAKRRQKLKKTRKEREAIALELRKRNPL